MNDPEPYDAVVIGGGKGGKTLAMYLARQNYKVALIERDPMMIGGGCINVACIPTKTFITSARLVHSIRRAGEYGIKVEGVSVCEARCARSSNCSPLLPLTIEHLRRGDVVDRAADWVRASVCR